MKAFALMVVAGLAVTASSCGGGGSIESSPERDSFNAALDRCANGGGESQQREACMSRVMMRYQR